MKTTLAFPGASRRFFASKADFLAYRAAWRRLVASGRPLAAGHYAAYALLTGRDLYQVFGRNERGNGQLPYGALARALAAVLAPRNTELALAWSMADVELPPAFDALRGALTAAGLAPHSHAVALVAQGLFDLASMAASFEESAHG